MKFFINSLKAEQYKFIKSKLIWLHLLIPLAGVFMFISYYKFLKISDVNKLMLYLQAIALSFPMVIALSVSMNLDLELENKFQNLLIQPISKILAHFTKIINILGWSAISLFISIVLFGVLFNSSINFFEVVNLYFKVMLLLFLSVIPIYFITYICAFTFGKNISLVLGIFGTVFGALMETGLGESIWHITIWGTPIRWVGYSVLEKFTDNKLLFSELFRNSIFITLGLVILLVLSFIFWSENWEGNVVSKDE